MASCSIAVVTVVSYAFAGSERGASAVIVVAVNASWHWHVESVCFSAVRVCVQLLLSLRHVRVRLLEQDAGASEFFLLL